MPLKPRTLVVLTLVLAAAAACVRLGFWQIDRWHQKQFLNKKMREGLAAPVFDLRDGSTSETDSVEWSHLRVEGTYDESRQILLFNHSHSGQPGVEVVTPLRFKDGGAILVNRGWLYAPDAMTAHP